MSHTPTHEGHLPVGKVKLTGPCRSWGYCKYCHKNHQDWWEMRWEDYREDVVLCGKCEHAHRRCFIFDDKEGV